jgi:hypothetical protein
MRTASKIPPVVMRMVPSTAENTIKAMVRKKIVVNNPNTTKMGTGTDESNNNVNKNAPQKIQPRKKISTSTIDIY